ncbi:Holliday junction recognition protein isoform X1 [Dasypus novemcinctus]|uniref:Holliday junction recognition protein isoform X1 n=1 Tax=Dasypus novemcinctus TaxID=9361 RepID=UPI00265F1659|nr:Holliday junction recognition protein isoform X1 [Dasypus novemcinctus]
MASESGMESVCAMESESLEKAALVRKLQDSRCRFQRRMQQLIEKYNQPFEDAPLVQMTTLTYETPQGLRIWGGGLIKEMNTEQIQESFVELVNGINGPVQAAGKDLRSNDFDATLDLEDPVAGVVRCTENGGGRDTRLTLSPSLASPAKTALGHYSDVYAKNLGHPIDSASSHGECGPSRPRSADMALVPRNDSLWLPGTRDGSFLNSQSFEAEDTCDVTISDLYTGMLHSMSQLLSAKPSCTISTKTLIVQNWNSRRRLRGKNRMNKTYCRGGRPSQRSSKKRAFPSYEPGKKVEVLRDAKNLLNASCHQTGSKLGKVFLEVNKPQIRKSDPSRKELRLTPQKHSSLTYLRHNDDQENRLMALKWLISPVKTVSNLGTRQGHRGNRYREIEINFEKLHQEYCPNPGKQPSLTYLPSSWGMDVYRGSPKGSETQRLSITFPKRLSESFENQGERSLEGGRYLLKSNSDSSLSKTDAAHSTSHFELTCNSLFQGGHPGVFRMLFSPSKAMPKPGLQALGGGRNHYDEIKEKFNKLHQKYCQKLPQQTKETLCIRHSPNKASTLVQYKKGDLGKFNPDPCLQGLQKLSSPQCSMKSPWGSTPVKVLPSTCIAQASRRDHLAPAKRRRLSDPQLCGQWADCWNPSSVVSRAIPRPQEEAVCPLQLDFEEKAFPSSSSSAFRPTWTTFQKSLMVPWLEMGPGARRAG